MLIHVLAIDIRRGLRRCAYSCPIARAIHRATGRRFTDRSITVTINGAHINGLAYRLSKASARFIRKFDGHYSVRPASFRITKITD